MATLYESISEDLEQFIQNQKIFFVATAADEGRINLSPKGLDSLTIVDSNTVLWLNLTGSGNETAAHLLQNDRMTMMFCSFEKKPMILRLYGTAKVFHPRDSYYQDHISLFPETPGARQIFVMKVSSVQTSCGYAVPLMDFQEERPVLSKWTKNKGEKKIEDYWVERNSKSIDGFDTGIVDK